MNISMHSSNAELQEAILAELQTGKPIITDIVPVSNGYTTIYIAQNTPEDRIPTRSQGTIVSSIQADCLGWNDPNLPRDMYILRGRVNVLDAKLEQLNLEIGKAFSLPSVTEEIVIHVRDTFLCPYDTAKVVSDSSKRVRTCDSKPFYSITTLVTASEFAKMEGHSTFKYDAIAVGVDVSNINLADFGNLGAPRV